MVVRDFAWGIVVGICVSLIVWAACIMLADPYLQTGAMEPAIPWRAVEIAEAPRIRAERAERQRDDWKRRHDVMEDNWLQAAYRARDYAERYHALLYWAQLADPEREKHKRVLAHWGHFSILKPDFPYGRSNKFDTVRRRLGNLFDLPYGKLDS
jgi:hypothetical protein